MTWRTTVANPRVQLAVSGQGCQRDERAWRSISRWILLSEIGLRR